MTYWSGIWKGMKGIEFEREPFMWRFYKELLAGYELRGKRVLEIGCGTGINTLFMAKAGARVTFLDSSPEALKIAKRNARKFGVTGKFICQDALDVNLKNEFDLVHSEGVIEHFRGKPRQQIIDVHVSALKSDGKIIIIVPNMKCPPYRIGKWLAEKTGTWVHGAEWPYSKLELETRLKRAGTTIERFVGGELLFGLGWLFAPLWLNGSVLERSIKHPASEMLFRLNYNNFFANRWGRVVACVARKIR